MSGEPGTASRSVNIEASWHALLADEFSQTYMQNLSGFLRAEKQKGKVIYPPGGQIFSAFDATPVEDVKVVILGQDPYHGPGQAHGLCFSVQAGVTPPPSLVNIFKEIGDEFDQVLNPSSGDLTGWADQGVLLLNSVLTVERGRAGAHQGRGWEQFTDRVVAEIAAAKENLVFMLWGSYAQKKGSALDRNKHCVLQAPHPSPLSAHRGFFGCGHFTAANNYLEQQGLAPINWFDTERKE